MAKSAQSRSCRFPDRKPSSSRKGGLNNAAMAAPITFGTQGRIQGLLDPAILDRFLSLDQSGKCNAEYVWLGGTGSDLRSKTKTLDKAPESLKDLPTWNFDGSSTNQAPGTLRPSLVDLVRLTTEEHRQALEGVQSVPVPVLQLHCALLDDSDLPRD